MSSRVLSPEEIRRHVEQLVNTIPEIIENNATVNVPLPQRHEPDENGCNWDMKSFEGVSNYEHDIRALLEQARQSYKLPDQ